MYQHTNGLIAALFTPFNEDGSVNYNLFPRLVDHLVGTGHTGIFACGTNGEGPSLTLEERMAIVETIVRLSEDRLRTIVHVGHSSIAEAKKLAAHAARAGADAISSVAAFYFKPTSTANLVDSMAEIASAAPDLPFYYYHIPTLTGVTIDTLEFLQRAEKLIPNFSGIKFTSTALWEFMTCRTYQGGRYDILYGFDENFLATLAVGATGWIGSTYCFAAPLYNRVKTLFEQGELEAARSLMQTIIDIVIAIVNYPPIPAQRSVMKMLGFDFGSCRLPLADLTPTQENELRSKLNELGFFELLNNA